MQQKTTQKKLSLEYPAKSLKTQKASEFHKHTFYLVFEAFINYSKNTNKMALLPVITSFQTSLKSGRLFLKVLAFQNNYGRTSFFHLLHQQNRSLQCKLSDTSICYHKGSKKCTCKG